MCGRRPFKKHGGIYPEWFCDVQYLLELLECWKIFHWATNFSNLLCRNSGFNYVYRYLVVYLVSVGRVAINHHLIRLFR